MNDIEKLKEEHKAAMDTCSSIAAIVGKSDTMSLSEQVAAMKQQIEALAAESAQMRQIIESVTDRDNEPQYHSEVVGRGLEYRNVISIYDAAWHGWDTAMERVYSEVIPRAEELSFPATDAVIADIEARGVEKFSSRCFQRKSELLADAPNTPHQNEAITALRRGGEFALKFAEELRSGKGAA